MKKIHITTESSCAFQENFLKDNEIPTISIMFKKKCFRFPVATPLSLEELESLWQPTWSNDFPLVFFKDECYDLLKDYKSKIDHDIYNKNWDDMKKYYNEYEHIHISSSKAKRGENIAFYVPLSRSYFKLWEMIIDFDLIPSERGPWTSAHLAEGPGGFIEAVCKYREVNRIGEDRQDYYHGITLRSVKKEIPGWNKAQYFLKQHPNVHVHYGSDDTGNLYFRPNIEAFCQHVGEGKCHLVTADGGFDFSIDFNHQEHLSTRLVLAEITCMLSLLKKGGVFVCKFFDTYERLSAELLWFLTTVFDQVTLSKPVTSRPANSEKYAVCCGFRPVCPQVIERFRTLLEEYPEVGYLHSIFPGKEMNEDFISALQESNKTHSKNQIDAIKNTLHFITNKDDIHYNTILKDHINSCIRWCLHYRVPINRQCKYQHYVESRYQRFFRTTDAHQISK